MLTRLHKPLDIDAIFEGWGGLELLVPSLETYQRADVVDRRLSQEEQEFDHDLGKHLEQAQVEIATH